MTLWTHLGHTSDMKAGLRCCSIVTTRAFLYKYIQSIYMEIQENKAKNTQPSPKQPTVNQTQPHTKIEFILSIIVAHNLARFHENCLKTSRAILFTVERTNRQTDKRRRKHYRLGGGNTTVDCSRSTKLLYAGPG